MAAFNNLTELKGVYANSSEFPEVEISSIYLGSQKIFPVGQKSNDQIVFEGEVEDYVEPNPTPVEQGGERIVVELGQIGDDGTSEQYEVGENAQVALDRLAYELFGNAD